jgi:hypothetical protein
MLPLILALLTDPAAPSIEPQVTPLAPLRAMDDRLLPRSRRECADPRFQLAAPAGPGVAGQGRPLMNDLLHREGDAVRRYRLLERRIENCSVPISARVPTLGFGGQRAQPIPGERPDLAD